jgi:hypothetical protein
LLAVQRQSSRGAEKSDCVALDGALSYFFHAMHELLRKSVALR